MVISSVDKSSDMAPHSALPTALYCWFRALELRVCTIQSKRCTQYNRGELGAYPQNRG
eukprot:m.176337 g.176337  ORF g.176337 m.176337 type:complete len:58 (-) comp14147_c0_seq1:260-433(-)